MAQEAADGEGGEELVARHLERACGQHEGRERHGRRQDGGQRDREDGVRLHPVADGLEEARGDVFFEEGHAAGLADLVAEEAAEERAGGGRADEEEEIGVLRGEHHDHDVGDAGDGQRDEGRVDDGDEEHADDAEGEQQVEERVGVMGGGGRSGEALEAGAGRSDRGAGEHAIVGRAGRVEVMRGLDARRQDGSRG